MPEESADEDEEDSISRDSRDRSLADARGKVVLQNPFSKRKFADERSVYIDEINCAYLTTRIHPTRLVSKSIIYSEK